MTTEERLEEYLTPEEKLGEYLAGKTPCQIRKITEQRLLGEDRTFIFKIPTSEMEHENHEAHFDIYEHETPEDLIVELLKKADLSPAMRRGVIDGCEEVYLKLFSWISSPETLLVSGKNQEKETIFRLCEAVKEAVPPELEGLSHAAFSSILDKPEIHGKIRKTIAEAFAVYANIRDSRSWIEALETPETAGCAFEVLLKILPANNIYFFKKSLRDLWHKRFAKGWEIDVHNLARKMEKKYGFKPIEKVLSNLHDRSLKNSNPDWWEALRADLSRRSYSKKWLDAAGLGESQVRLSESDD